MSRFDLLCEAKSALSRAIDFDDLLCALFAEHPDLHSFEFQVTNEYDDNNYSDYSRLVEVNGRRVDCDGRYEDDEEEDGEIPNMPEEIIDDIVWLSEYIKEKHGHGDHNFVRGDYKGGGSSFRGKANMECALAILDGRKVATSVLLEAGERWIIRHAELHGRYKKEDEFLLFAREGMMGAAMEYAKMVGHLSEKTLNYFVLTMNSESHEYDSLQEYLKWTKTA
jgi:hypothetical protein